MIFISLILLNSPFVINSHFGAASSAEISRIQKIDVTAYQKELSVAKEVALEAGVILMNLWKTDLAVETKPGEKGRDSSPVTQADFDSNQLICSTLVKNFSDYGLLTEEHIEDPVINHAKENWINSEYCWYIDPLDGTKSFIKGDSDFGIHIGLCQNGIPVLGVNYFPALKTIYWAVKNQGAYKQVDGGEIELIHVRELPRQIIPLYSSDRSNESYYCLILETTPEAIQEIAKTIGSIGLRITWVAEGSADIFMADAKNGGLWDYCSSHIILEEAGGLITDLYGNKLDYRDPDAKLKKGCLTCGDEKIYQKSLEAAQKLAL